MSLFGWREARQWKAAAEAAIDARNAWQEATRIEHGERLEALNLALSLAIVVDSVQPSADSATTVSALVGMIADVQLAGDTLIPSPVDPT